ncbi:hypothetical protein NST17_03875 [Caldifermentibacillus hisashii]|uniref:Uncharacterized protein n=2 Tax=Caldifermentibacillus hisashii TaxID=996558 RepID=A0ABU9JU18_9BACI
MATRLVLVTVFGRKSLIFGDEASSRHRFWSKISHIWRRGQFSSPFLVENLIFLATKPNLVVIFGRKPLNFGDEACSRHRFWSKISYFWRRNLISSSFLVENLSILATKLVLVTVLRRKMHYFDDETRSRHRFEAKNALFWRRDSFSSPFLVENLIFLATKPNLVVILR